MKGATIKGTCAVCNKPVFHNQPRNKNQDGSYVYAECEGVDSDIGPMNVTGRWSSMLPGQIQQLQNFGQHEVQPRFVKGMCTLWNCGTRRFSTSNQDKRIIKGLMWMYNAWEFDASRAVR